ncbi:hypothetical protein ACLK2D_02415 [Escherichia coli]
MKSVRWEFHNPLKGHVAEPHRQVWIRANGSVPDDLRFISICSVMLLILISCRVGLLQPHGIGFLEPGIQIATIDHSMWFHSQFNLNEWLLYSVESASASSARGFVAVSFIPRTACWLPRPFRKG